MRIQFAKSCKKDFKVVPRWIQDKADERIVQFAQHPYAVTLNNHALSGEWAGYRSINITGNWRAIYEPVGDDLAYFVRLATHPQLYR